MQGRSRHALRCGVQWCGVQRCGVQRCGVVTSGVVLIREVATHSTAGTRTAAIPGNPLTIPFDPHGSRSEPPTEYGTPAPRHAVSREANLLTPCRVRVLGTASESVRRHVFLSYNSKDEASVRVVAKALRAEGVTYWFDAEELTAGDLVVEELERGLASCDSAALFVAGSGLGPWEVLEYYVLLSDAVEQRKRIIPIILPGAPAKPALPKFTQVFRRVDMRAGVTREKIQEIVAGIREGRLPDRLPDRLPVEPEGLRSGSGHGDDVEAARRVFLSLDELRGDPEIDSEIRRAIDALRGISGMVGALRQYKTLHDSLHDLQFQSLDFLLREARSAETSAVRWSDVEASEGHVFDRLTWLQEFSTNEQLSDTEQEWINELGLIHCDLRSACEDRSLDALARTARELKRYLATRMPMVNHELVKIAHDVELAAILAALDRVVMSMQARNLTETQLDRVRSGVESIRRLDERVKRGISDHDRWQVVDQKARLIADTLDERIDADYLARRWPELEGRIEQATAGAPDPYTERVRHTAVRMRDALSNQESSASAGSVAVSLDQAQIGQRYRECVHAVGQQFLRVDKRLHKLFDELTDVGGPLRTLLDNLDDRSAE